MADVPEIIDAEYTRGGDAATGCCLLSPRPW
jgi:hypothetical protein